jgi:hypothetical protein
MSNPISARIISDTPGRLRLRVAPGDRQAEKMQQIVPQLEKHANIQQVRTNIPHGSIIINHDGNLNNVIATLQDIGIMFTDVAQGSTEAASNFSNVVIDLNKRVEQTTQGAVDLRFLFPFGLSFLAVRQLLIKGWELEVIPWYVLAWYAFDSFMKLNRTGQPQTSSKNERSPQIN